MAENFVSSVSSKEFDKALLGGLDAANGKFAKKEEFPTVPTKMSELENDAGYLKSFTEADPTVPAWAKESTKPSYTKNEVGLGNVDNVKQYSASNPPPYPVTSVNGVTGAVTVAVPEIVQATGDSESAVMSQKAVTDALVSKNQLSPEFAESVDWLKENGDQSKMYVLPDGFIYAYQTGEAQEVFTDVLKDVGYTKDQRINSSGAFVAENAKGSDVTGYIPCKTGDVIRIKNMAIPDAYADGAYWSILAAYNSSKTYIKQTNLILDYSGYGDQVDAVSENGNIVQFTVKDSFFGPDVAFIALSAKEITDASEVYVNSTMVDGSAWVNTGLAFVPADYEDRIIALENEVAELGGTVIPGYWASELKTKADAIQQAMESAGRNKSAFLWYTDAHWQTNSKVSPLLLKFLLKNTPMNKVNFGGDIINDPAAFTHDNIKYAYEWRAQIADLTNHHSVAGNHDLNHNSTDVRKTAYAFLIASEESPDMVMGGELYYYIDNPAEKTRYLYLDYMTSDHTEMTDQGQFIVDAIKSVSDGWHIVVIAHRWFQYTSASEPTVGSIPSYEEEILQVFDAYNARTTHSASNYFATQNFADSKGKVEFCIGGHIHVDYDFETAGGIPVIITAADTNQERSPDDTEDSGTIETTTESAVFGIIADYTANKITVVGIGRGTSRIVEGA